MLGEDDPESWFTNYGESLNGNFWTNEIRSIKFPSLLKNTAKLFWPNITIDKNNYIAVKEKVL